MAEGILLKNTGDITTESQVADTNFAGYVGTEEDTKTATYNLVSSKIPH